MTPKKQPHQSSARWSDEELDAFIEEATIDANGESEAASGFFAMMENDLALPFDTQILGFPVSVVSIDMDDRDEIMAICRAGAKKQKIRIVDVPLPEPPPEGAEWIAAYKKWLRGFGGGGDDDEE